jgi:hypothetical protein
VTERPILFTGPMVRAILAGQKTQTRRPVKWTPIRGFDLGFSGLTAGHYNTANPASPWVLYSRRGDGVWEQRTEPLRCPYGAPGDRLWVREAFRYEDEFRQRVAYRAGQDPATDGHRWKPGIHLPRCHSRLLLEVTDVRVERLHTITEDDARAEGMGTVREAPDVHLRHTFIRRWAAMYDVAAAAALHNPWVWVVTFRRVEAARSAA